MQHGQQRPAIDCPNANWNGVTTNYCDGVTSDDVVSHEWGHAYTEYTAGLIYQCQPGALNESYSDVWGETVDLINGPRTRARAISPPSVPRAVQVHCPAVLGVTINSPAAIAGSVRRCGAGFGPEFDITGVTADVVVGIDAADDDWPEHDRRLHGDHQRCRDRRQVAYVDRGSCAFKTKVKNAVAAGHRDHRRRQRRRPARSRMAGVRHITGLMVIQADGNLIKAAGTVNVTINATDTEQPARLLPVADGREGDRRSAAPSATCGRPPATATRARCPTRSTTAPDCRQWRRAQQLRCAEPPLRADRRRRHLHGRPSPGSVSTRPPTSGGAPRPATSHRRPTSPTWPTRSRRRAPT